MTAARRGDHIALSGGSAPGPVHELAARLEPDWSRATVWWGDERCVPPDDERSNYRLARETLLERLEEPPAVERVDVELGCDEAADDYDRRLEGIALGFALQGIGPDGHTASLFPEAPTLAERRRRAVAAPHDDVDRVTMTIPMLSSARLVLFLALGESKADAVAHAFGGRPSTKVPASLVRSEGGDTVVLLDRQAAARLDN